MKTERNTKYIANNNERETYFVNNGDLCLFFVK